MQTLSLSQAAGVLETVRCRFAEPFVECGTFDSSEAKMEMAMEMWMEMEREMMKIMVKMMVLAMV